MKMKEFNIRALVVACTIICLFIMWFSESKVTKAQDNLLNIYRKETTKQDSLLQVKSDSIKLLQQQLFKANTLVGLTATVYYPTGDQMRSGKLIPTHYHWSSAEVKYIAISQDLWSRYGGPLSFGDKVVVSGTPLDTIYEVEDTMNKRHRNRVDILVERGLINEQWGNIQITKV